VFGLATLMTGIKSQRDIRSTDFVRQIAVLAEEPSKPPARDARSSLRNLRKLDCAGKAAQRPSFPSPAPAGSR
jgi:hypothetical protein